MFCLGQLYCEMAKLCDEVNIFRNQAKPHPRLSKHHIHQKEKSGNESTPKAISVARNVSEDGVDDISMSSVAKLSHLDGNAKQAKQLHAMLIKGRN